MICYVSNICQSLRASGITGVPTRIYAVEKNLHAVITLRNRAVVEEWDNVRIIEKGDLISLFWISVCTSLVGSTCGYVCKYTRFAWRGNFHLIIINFDCLIIVDMRRYVPTELSDIMVSELLGSWGDNELSPECLDIAQETCLKSDGVSTCFILFKLHSAFSNSSFIIFRSNFREVIYVDIRIHLAIELFFKSFYILMCVL